ncbi:hypothetical protein AAKU55_002280 [Oxalobacteraceae bacterium GrIS 1.11]
MSPHLKSIVVACSLALAAITTPVQARILTLTTTGTISGFDSIGLFSQTGGVHDEQFTETVSIDMAGLTTGSRTSAENISSTSPGGYTMVSGSMTIAGGTYSWQGGYSTATAALGRYVSLGQSGPDYVGMGINCLNELDFHPNSRVISNLGIASDSTAFVNSVDFAQNTLFNTHAAGVTSYLDFSIVQYDYVPVQLESQNAFTTAAWTISAVPEPGTAGMLMVGLGVMAAMRRRKGRV